MKKTITTILIIVLAAMLLNSCDNASELPPLDNGFATQFILPDPVDLTEEDRAYLDELEEEYENAISAK